MYSLRSLLHPSIFVCLLSAHVLIMTSLLPSSQTVQQQYRYTFVTYCFVLQLLTTSYRQEATILLLPKNMQFFWYTKTIATNFGTHKLHAKYIVTTRSSYASAVLGIVILSVCSSVHLSVCPQSVRHTRAL